MDRRKSVLNVTTSILSRILLLISALIVRRLLIQHIGNDVNGLNSLYSSIIGVLAVAELGVGSAIVYSMYKPIVDGEQKKVAALYGLYTRLYRVIGGVILVAGLAVMPFLPGLMNDYEDLNVNVYVTFGLSLIAVVLSYLYGAKTSLIEAYKDNYLTTVIMTIGHLVQYGLQVAVILLFRSFPLFLVCQIFSTALIWVLTEIVVRKRHEAIIAMHEAVDPLTRAEVVRNIKAMLMHKIGTIMVNTVDSVIISAFVGVVILGKYSNYALIVSVMAGTIALFFSPLTSVVGHLCAGGDATRIKGAFDHFYCINYILGVIFFLGYYAVIDSIIRLCFGAGLEMSRSIAFIITLDGFTKFMRQTALLFRNASGTFYYDRWKPIVEGIMNLILSLLFVQVFPEDKKVVGVIVATIITTLLICHIVDPYVVYKHVFKKTVKSYWLKNYSYIALFAAGMAAMTYLGRQRSSNVAELFLNGIISIGVSMIILGAVSIIDQSFRSEIITIGRKVMNLRRNMKRI